MPKLRIKAKNISPEQIDIINTFILSIKGDGDLFAGVPFQFRIRHDFNKEDILELGWEYVTTDEKGISTFEYMIFNLDLFPNDEVWISENEKIKFKGKIESKKKLKQLMSILQIA